MTCNVGGADKAVRIIVGAALVAVALLVAMPLALQIVLFVAAAIALVTAFVGFCPLNKLLGINTCKASANP
jgi:hypothetical protein